MPSLASDWLSLYLFSVHGIFLKGSSQGEDSIFISVHEVFYTLLPPGKVMGITLGFLLQEHYTCSDRNMALGPLIFAEIITFLYVQMVD